MTGVDSRYQQIVSRFQILDLRSSNTTRIAVILNLFTVSLSNLIQDPVIIIAGDAINILKSKINNLYSSLGAKS